MRMLWRFIQVHHVTDHSLFSHPSPNQWWTYNSNRQFRLVRRSLPNSHIFIVGAILPRNRSRQLPLACQPLSPSTYPFPSQRHSLGSFTVECPSCHALHWIEERLTSSSTTLPKFGMCCNRGKISWPTISDPPEPLRSLLDGTTRSSGIYIHCQKRRTEMQKPKNFAKISGIITTLLLSLLLVLKVDSSVYSTNGVFTFRIQGELCHRISSLLPRIGEQPKFA